MKRILSILLVLFGLSTLPLQAQKEVTLRLHPEKGLTYTVHTKNSMMNLIEVQGQSMASSQTTEMKHSFVAKDLNDQVITVEGTLKAMKVTISQMGMSLTYDSEHPEKTSPMLAGQTDEFEKEINVPTIVQFDCLGHHTDTTEMANMVQSISAIIPLPEEPIRVGSSWTSHRSQDISGTAIDAKMTYTVTKISKKSVEVSVEGKVEGTEGISGSYEGTATLNPVTGLVVKSNVKMNMSMTLEQEGLSLPLTMSGTTTVTLE